MAAILAEDCAYNACASSTYASRGAISLRKQNPGDKCAVLTGEAPRICATAWSATEKPDIGVLEIDVPYGHWTVDDSDFDFMPSLGPVHQSTESNNVKNAHNLVVAT
jgi:hypothetical protein